MNSRINELNEPTNLVPEGPIFLLEVEQKLVSATFSIQYHKENLSILHPMLRDPRGQYKFSHQQDHICTYSQVGEMPGLSFTWFRSHPTCIRRFPCFGP